MSISCIYLCWAGLVEEQSEHEAGCGVGHCDGHGGAALAGHAGHGGHVGDPSRCKDWVGCRGVWSQSLGGR